MIFHEKSGVMPYGSGEPPLPVHVTARYAALNYSVNVNHAARR